LDGFAVDALDVFGAWQANTTHFHNKFCMLHRLPVWVAISLKRGAYGKTAAGKDVSLPAATCLN